MKKHFWLLLVASLFAVLFLAGCGNGGDPTSNPAETTAESGETTAPSADDPYAGQFRVGHGRVNITPKDSVPLAGYGNTEFRLSTGFLDYVYATCIAITDENDETMLIYAIDIIKANTKVTGDLREIVSAATGVPADHILLNTSHTHSMIDQDQSGMKVVQEWIQTYKQNCVEAARLALADRLPAKMYWTSVDLKGYNFVRHYLTDKGEGYSVNHTKYAVGTPVKHTSEANPTMFLLKFEREGGKDVMLSNWRCHNVLTSTFSGGGDQQKTNISSDWTGQVRTYIEKELDVYYAYFMGDSGNIVASTSLPEEVEHHPPRDCKQYSREVADLMIPAIKGAWEEIQTGPIQIVTETFTGKTNKSELEHLAEARKVYDYWREHNSGSECVKADPTHYIQSQYHAVSIIGRPSLPDSMDFMIAAGRIGDFAFTQAPFETFDTNGNFVRENSPTKYTFVMGYSNEHYGYLTSSEAFDYGCYESDVARFGRGVAEDLASRFVELLNQIYGK